MEATIENIQGRIKSRFTNSKRVLTFDEYLDFVSKDPIRNLRCSYHYLLDAIEHFGHYPKQERGKEIRRYKIFDQEEFLSPQPLVGQEALQNRFVEILTGFVRSGKADKLITLYGPNGSSKSSFVKTLFEGLEKYSSLDDGILFSFSWIFPEESIQKGKLGIGAPRDDVDPSESFAKLEQDKIGAIVRSELHENPLFLIPKEDRAILFDSLVKDLKDVDKDIIEKYRKTFLESEASHKNTLIFEALLNEYQGDYRKVMRHVRVERLYLSRSIRKGLVMIEPKFSVDASIRQVTLDKSMANLPPALQSLNLFQLEGDLVDGNRGIVEYSDFLKRPVESFKYLLNTCESRSVNLGNVVVFLDTIFMGTTNDRQLEAFREHPEFYSFKSRLELVRVPYLLRYSDEMKIYESTAKDVKGEKELMPHTCKTLALWAVLTRLKKPLSKNKSTAIVKLVENLSPLQKALLYDSAETPEGLSAEERHELIAHIEELSQEHSNHVYYEGLLGASARELKVVLQTATQNPDFHTLGPSAIIHELKKLVKRVTDYDYLRQEPVPGGYHDFGAFIEIVQQQWFNWVDKEMREVISIHSDVQIEESFSSYIKQVIFFVKGEKVKNRITGENENADESQLKKMEDILDVTNDLENFRKNLIAKLGAWSIDHKDISKDKVPYSEVFPQYIEKIRHHYHQKNVKRIQDMGKLFLDTQNFEEVASKDPASMSQAEQLAHKAYHGMQEKFGYGPEGAKEALLQLIRERYR